MKKEKLQNERSSITKNTDYPIGSVLMWFTDEIPVNWIKLEGQELNKNDYPELFNLIGYRFGGSGSKFNVPKMEGSPYRIDNTDKKLNAYAKKCGEKEHKLTIDELASHEHKIVRRGFYNVDGGWSQALSSIPIPTDPGSLFDSSYIGNDKPHNSVHPVTVTNFIMYTGKSQNTSQVIPFSIGSVIMWYSDSVPSGWSRIVGQDLNKNDFPELFKLLGYKYGGSQDIFRMPEMKGSPYKLDITDAALNDYNKKYGEKEHKLSVDQLPSHKHDFSKFGAFRVGYGGASCFSSVPMYLDPSITLNSNFSNSNTGNNIAHNTIHPITVCEFLMYTGEHDTKPTIYPDRYEDLPKNERTIWHALKAYYYPEKAQLNAGNLDLWAPNKEGYGYMKGGYPAIGETFIDENGNTVKDPSKAAEFTPICGTYKVVDCDEITAMAQNFRIHSGWGEIGGYLEQFDIRQTNIEHWLGEVENSPNLLIEKLDFIDEAVIDINNTGMGNGTTPYNNFMANPYWFEVEPNTTYETNITKGWGGDTHLFDANKKYIGLAGKNGDGWAQGAAVELFTTPPNARYFRFHFHKINNLRDFSNNFFLRKYVVKTPSPITNLKDYDHLFGELYAKGNKEISALLYNYVNDIYTADPTIVPTAKNIRETENWGIMTEDEFYQLIGQAPRYSGNVIEDLFDFFFCSTNENKYGIKYDLMNRKNISKLTFTPGSIQQNASVQYGRLHEYFLGHGNTMGIVLNPGNNKNPDHAALTIISDQSKPGYWEKGFTIRSTAEAWGGYIRYSRVKTSQELGYKLIIDNKENTVNFTDPDYVPSNEIIDIPDKTLIPYQGNGIEAWGGEGLNWFSDTRSLDNQYISKVEIYCGKRYWASPDNATFTISIIDKSDKSIITSFSFNLKNDEPEKDKIRTFDINYQLKNNETIAFGKNGDTVVFGINSNTPHAGGGLCWPNGYSDANIMIGIYTNKIQRYQELPLGLQRGIALRYANRENKIITKSWTEIQAEAMEIKSALKI